MSNNLKMLRLKSGGTFVGNGDEVDVLAEVKYNSSNDTVTLTNPLVVRMLPPEKEGDNPRLGLFPYLYPFIAQDFMSIHQSDILTSFKLTKEVEDRYNALLNPSPLVVPEEKKLILPE